ncbi:uncharacterized protein PFL1_00903 [Pseudozyma flocculosa PF-1]|uniref:Related to protein arginine N-methyltransferase n=1 Tax=Pseudozyma flocculosa TaxID=84751 RepID=A0A5C3F5F6_9BASI|nr:uncharacterized protein PFL1_00903 [Pseudozyma flocculosa PF-1]EPQ31570.1 hypothetical protein PFL1_00903 [Pseudozyma flocculosa PF-1]SPO38639.1 related to protein arginine N-methyltransferase [Pseudozyma flocculosa]
MDASAASSSAQPAELPLPNGQQSERQPLALGLHVPTSVLSFSPSTAQAPSPPLGTNAHRRSHVQPPGGALPTLIEASHANALHAATGPSPAALGLDADLDAASAAALAGLGPVQRTLSLSRSQGYDLLVLELANERWKERWERLCLADPNQASPRAPVSIAIGSPSNVSAWGNGGTAIHDRGMARSSSRHGLASGMGPGKLAPSPGFRPAEATFMDTAREAEEWRRAPAFRRGEVTVTKLEETEGLVALASPWIELDSLDEGVRLDSEIALRQELAYAAYLGISNVVLPPPSSEPARRPFLPDYARAINSCLSSGGTEAAPAGQWMNLSIKLPISSPYGLAKVLAAQASRGHGLGASGSAASNVSAAAPSAAAALLRADDDWAWETWEHVRQLCSYSTRLHVALDFGYPLPSPNVLGRWIAEPVSMLWLPSVAYLANAKGFPVLSKASQTFIKSLIKKAPTVILSGVQTPPPTHTRGGPLAYMQYVKHMEKTAPPESAVDAFARGYTDWLQAPLQPLMDNLEGTTYEVFERDPVKYALYEEAVYKALLDKPAGSTTSIWVCGAGRGPLVDRCLNASRRAGRAVRMTALEKNPNALVTLQERQALDWGDLVDVRYGDMRTHPVPHSLHERPDIVVSELLGSFGDNELSPECLDGAMRFLKPDGISIPSSYTAYLSPLTSSKLHTEVMSGSASSSGQALRKAAETPYVVLFQNVALLAAAGGRHAWDQVQESWSFEHRPAAVTALVYDANGLPLTNGHNVRSATHTFHIPQPGTCHGLAGYFEAHLYGDVAMSIHPDPMRGSKDMLSWFPIYFPFKDPLYLPPNSELDVHMWRQSGNGRVWYEWCAESFMPLPGDAVRAIQATANATGHSTTAISAAQSGGAAATLGAAAAEGPNNFANAPATPRIPSGPAPPPADATATGPVLLSSPLSSLSSGGGGGVVRVKTGMTALHNPGGRSSWIGL